VACTVGRVQDLVVEDRKVECKSQADWVSGRELSLGDIGGVLVSLVGSSGSNFTLLALGEFGKVAVVVTLHLVVENL